MHLERIRRRMEDEDIDCVIATEKSNFIYSIGYEAAGYLFIRPEKLDLILPRFYLYDLEEYDAEYFYTSKEAREKLSKISEDINGEVITDAENPDILKDKFDASHSNLFSELRLTKTDEEVEKIKQACQITDEAFIDLRQKLFDGRTELEAQLELKKFYSSRKVTESFISNGDESLVQKNCLKPHRPPRDRLIESDDLVIVDTGARKDFYCADVTRTYCKNPSEEQIKLFEAVKKIQQQMIEMISPGQKISEVVERKIEMSKELGYNPGKNVLYFGHNIGIEVHESPSISLSTDREFKEGMVVTIEPGIHVPDLGGVRIEDTVHVGSSGAERLSDAERRL